MLSLVSSIYRDATKCISITPMTPSIQKKLTLIKNNANAIVGELEKIKQEKNKNNTPLINQVSTTYKRFPKIYLYGHSTDSDSDFEYDSDDDDHNMALELFSAKHKDIQVGDFICKRDAYRSNGIYLVTRDGKLGDPIILGNGLFGIPAWVFELGMAHGHSFDALKKLYISGEIGASFFVYPKSLQGTSLKFESGYIMRARIWDMSDESDQVISEGSDLYDDIEDFFDANVFLQTKTSNTSNTSNTSKISKTSKKSATKEIIKKSSSSTANPLCVKQTTKKYTDRPSPPFPAADCPGLAKKGNNGKMYESIANVKGIYSWKLQK